MKIWQYNTLSIDHARQWCIDQVKANLPAGVEHTLLWEYLGITNSNAIRYKLLLEPGNEYDCWLDTDVIITSWWTPPDDGCIYSNYSSSVFFPNGQKKLLTKMYNYFVKNECTYQVVEEFRVKYPKMFKPVPSEAFFHLALSLGNVIAPVVSNDRCMLENSGSPDMRLVWVKGVGYIS